MGKPGLSPQCQPLPSHRWEWALLRKGFVGSRQVVNLTWSWPIHSPVLQASPPPTIEEGMGTLSSSNPCWLLTKWSQWVEEGREGTC